MPTRWGSVAEMISRFLEQIDAVNAVLVADRKSQNLLLPADAISVLEALDRVISPLSELTDSLSSDRHVNISGRQTDFL